MFYWIWRRGPAGNAVLGLNKEVDGLCTGARVVVSGLLDLCRIGGWDGEKGEICQWSDGR